MKPKPLGCLTPPGLLAALILVVVLAVYSLLNGNGLFSPGFLNGHNGPGLNGVTSHLQLSDRCETCHVPPFNPETMSLRCLACHSDIQAQLSMSNTMHGALKQGSEDLNCRNCHTEHLGKDSTITRLDRVDFPHAATGFALTAHQRSYAGNPFQCGDCHLQNLSSFDPAVCLACHAEKNMLAMQEHTRAFGVQCLACHDGLDRYTQFDHNQAAFKLFGKHVGQTCSACHSGDASLKAVQSRSQECGSCHLKDDAHQGQMGSGCGSCHSSEGWKPATFDHSKAAFSLVGKHTTVACSDCHKDALFKNTAVKCVDCHAKNDPHQNQLGQDCSACHTPSGWKPSTFDHKQSAFKLTGKHLTVSCDACHSDQLFKTTPAECGTCHAKDDAHKGAFGANCGACHSTTAWKPATFDHGKSVFPLTGKHAQVQCQACHKNSIFAGTPTQCAACHADPAFHAGLFPGDCGACHTTSGWSPAQFKGPHNFPINHGGANSCRSCHPSSLGGYTCFNCHNQNQMISKHSEEGISDLSNCTRCHANGRGGG